MFPSLRPTETMALVGVINPSTKTAGTPDTTGWIKADQFANYLCVNQTGVLGASATFNAKLEQATSAAGAGAKDVPGKAITAVLKAGGDNTQEMIELRPDELDIQAGFYWFRLSQVHGTANGISAGQVYGVGPRYAPPNQVATVTEIVR